MFISHIDHVQLAMPSGQEVAAHAFYSDALGLPEIEKPSSLIANGGVWFGSEGVNVHLGVDPNFVAAKKAHPAFRVRDIDTLAKRLKAAGFLVVWDDRLPNTRRFYSDDPFGNRIEFMDI